MLRPDAAGRGRDRTATSSREVVASVPVTRRLSWDAHPTRLDGHRRWRWPCFVIGRLFGVIELYVLGAGIIALVIVCVVWTHWRQVSLTVDRRVIPERLQVGEIGRVELRITNLAPSRTSPLVLWEPVAGMGGAHLRLAPLRRHESTIANYRLPASRRGTIVFGPLTVERRDPFGISSQRTVVAGTHEVVILPAHMFITIPTGAGGSGPVGQHLRMRALGRSGTEFHALRDYSEGDDLRQVHWKASARSENLKVREVEPDGLRRCTVALDDTTTEYSPEGFERAVSVAASAIASASRAGLQLRLVIGTAVDLRHTTVTAAMTSLADCVVSTTPGMSFRGTCRRRPRPDDRRHGQSAIASRRGRTPIARSQRRSDRRRVHIDGGCRARLRDRCHR